MSLVVECDERRYDYVEVTRSDCRAGNGLPDAKRTTFQYRVDKQITENHFTVPSDDRAENALICAPRARDDAAGVNLVMHGQVTPDGACGVKFMTSNESFGDRVRRRSTIVGVHRAACSQCRFS